MGEGLEPSWFRFYLASFFLSIPLFSVNVQGIIRVVWNDVDDGNEKVQNKAKENSSNAFYSINALPFLLFLHSSLSFARLERI